MKKVFNFGKVDFYKKGNAVNKVEVEVEYKENDKGQMRFSASGSVWNAYKSDIYSGGQNLDTIAEYIKDKTFDKIYRLWKLYHLNDMHAECEHQRQLGWREKAKGKVNFYNWRLRREASKEQDDIKNRAMTALKNCESFYPTEHESFMANLSYSLKTYTETLPEDLQGYYMPKKPLYAGDEGFIEEKTLGWLNENEHPDGLLGRPCPVCGYKYGHGWQYMPIPKEDEEIILELLK